MLAINRNCIPLIRPINFDRDPPDILSFLDEQDQAHLARIQKAVQENDAFVHVAELGGQIAGWSVLHTRWRDDLGWKPDPDTEAFLKEENAYLANLKTKDSARKFGLGTKLLEAAERAARKSGKTTLWLHVDESNAPAHLFYERRRWRHDRTVHPGWKDGRPTRVYRKYLK